METGVKTVVLLALWLAAGCVRLEEPDGYVRLQAGVAGEIDLPQTRGVPVSTLGTTFSVWAYAYRSGSGTPNYLCGETFTRVDASTSYRSAQVHGRLTSDFTVKWWAIAPVAPAGVTGLPTGSSSGAPSFAFTTPSTVTGQPDILVASTSASGGTVPSLTFNHVLGCLQFSTASTSTDVPACTINSISVSGVKNAATWTDGSGWGTRTGSATFTISPAKAISAGAVSTALHTEAESMLLLPQTLSGTLTVNFTPLGGSAISSSVALPNIVLSQGNKTVLRLKLSIGEGVSIESLENLFWGEKLDSSHEDLFWGDIPGTSQEAISW